MKKKKVEYILYRSSSKYKGYHSNITQTKNAICSQNKTALTIKYRIKRICKYTSSVTFIYYNNKKEDKVSNIKNTDFGHTTFGIIQDTMPKKARQDA